MLSIGVVDGYSKRKYAVIDITRFTIIACEQVLIRRSQVCYTGSLETHVKGKENLSYIMISYEDICCD